MDKNYILWVKSTCPFCVQAKDELLRRGLNHTVYIMDKKTEELEEVKTAWNHPTVPVILFSEGDEKRLIGGYTDLLTWLGGEK